MTLPRLNCATLSNSTECSNSFEAMSSAYTHDAALSTASLTPMPPNPQKQQSPVAATTAAAAALITEQLPQSLPHCQQPTSPTLVVRTTASSTIFSATELETEPVMPGIYLTKNFIAWNAQNLREHGFTHLIIIDKHIQELYYPAPVFKLHTSVYESKHASTVALNFSKDFEALDLNFGEKSYLTTVLPNCYRAVKFIKKAIQAGGTILVIDCNGGEQKCVTIVVAYLMYKHNISFSQAFERLKGYYAKADLDRFHMSQLYEYEPILQVQRAQSRGHSCSRELHSAILKRKLRSDELLNTLNPLSQFNAAQRLPTNPPEQHTKLYAPYSSDFHPWTTTDDCAME